jgi:hypothetical protein
MGLIGYDWVLAQNNLKSSDYVYEDFIEKAKNIVQFTKSRNCDIISLNHIRHYNNR